MFFLFYLVDPLIQILRLGPLTFRSRFNTKKSFMLLEGEALTKRWGEKKMNMEFSLGSRVCVHLRTSLDSIKQRKMTRMTEQINLFSESFYLKLSSCPTLRAIRNSNPFPFSAASPTSQNLAITVQQKVVARCVYCRTIVGIGTRSINANLHGN